jgi:hypothetical protein
MSNSCYSDFPAECQPRLTLVTHDAMVACVTSDGIMTLRGQGNVQHDVLLCIERAKQPKDTAEITAWVYESETTDDGDWLITPSERVAVTRVLKRLEREGKVHHIGRNELNREQWVTHARWLELCAEDDMTCIICQKPILDGHVIALDRPAHHRCWSKHHPDEETAHEKWINPIRNPDEYRRRNKNERRRLRREAKKIRAERLIETILELNRQQKADDPA